MLAALTCSFCPRLVGHPVNPMNRGGRLRPPLPATWQACFGSPSPCLVYSQPSPPPIKTAITSRKSQTRATMPQLKAVADTQQRNAVTASAMTNRIMSITHRTMIVTSFSSRVSSCAAVSAVPLCGLCTVGSTVKPAYRTDGMPRRRACVLSSSFASSFPPRYRSAHSLPANSFQRFLK